MSHTSVAYTLVLYLFTTIQYIYVKWQEKKTTPCGDMLERRRCTHIKQANECDHRLKVWI